MSDLFTIFASSLPPTTRVAAFRGSEGLSRPYAFDLHLVMSQDDSGDFDMSAAIGQRASLAFNREDGSARSHLHGVLASVELLTEVNGEGLYRAALVPAVWKLSLTKHSRVWVGDSVRTILTDVLRAGGLAEGTDFDFRLAKAPKPLEHVCQYKESNLDFISRWMEREGLYYFFEQGEDQEKLIITDSKRFHATFGEQPVHYMPSAGGAGTGGEVLEGFTGRQMALPATMKLNDYDELQPDVDIASDEVPVATNGEGDVVSWGEGYRLKDVGQRLAPIRADELLSRQAVYQGRGRVFDVRPGYLFDLEALDPAASPLPSRFPQRFLCTELEHQGSMFAGSEAIRRILGITHDREYTVRLQCLDATQQYRPPRRTPVPRIYGVESATIDGPQTSDYAQLDEHGRYLVKIRFDESDLTNGNASLRIRMLQPHGGNPEGFHFPLRKDTEVMLVFMGGDPDRPMIVGVAPNTLNPSPVIDENHTLNVVMTGGKNRIEMEDQEPNQYIDISTPPQKTHIHLGKTHDPHTHNWVISTDGTGLVHTGGNRDITVGGNQTEDVKGDVTETYHQKQDTTVDGNVFETYKSMQITKVTGLVSEDYGATHKTDVKGPVLETYKSFMSTKVSGFYLEETGFHGHTVNGAEVNDIKGDQLNKVQGAQINMLNTSQFTKTGANLTTMVGGTYMLSLTGPGTVLAPAGYTVISPARQETDVSWTKMVSNAFEFIGGKITAYTIKLDMGLSAIALNATKVDVTGAKVDIILAAKLATEPTKLETGGVALKTKGIHIFM